MMTTRWIAGFALAMGLAHHGPAPAYAWGAIAVDDGQGRAPRDVPFGFSLDEKSEEAARRGALKECRAKNGKCKVVITFEQCGAYAASGSVSAAGEGSTKGAARRDALAKCGNASCRSIVSACDE